MLYIKIAINFIKGFSKSITVAKKVVKVLSVLRTVAIVIGIASLIGIPFVLGILAACYINKKRKKAANDVKNDTVVSEESMETVKA